MFLIKLQSPLILFVLAARGPLMHLNGVIPWTRMTAEYRQGLQVSQQCYISQTNQGSQWPSVLANISLVLFVI